MMWESLKRLRALPDDTQLYCGHEYTLANAKFAMTVDPKNAALKERAAEVEKLRAAGKPTLPTTIGQEKATNPFLRADDPDIASNIGHGRGGSGKSLRRDPQAEGPLLNTPRTTRPAARGWQVLIGSVLFDVRGCHVRFEFGIEEFFGKLNHLRTLREGVHFEHCTRRHPTAAPSRSAPLALRPERKSPIRSTALRMFSSELA